MARRSPKSEYVTAAVPAIIETQIFERVQELLKARNPKITPPRTTTGPILFTGLAKCSSCSGGMSLRTGTSRSGRVHRYYSCSSNARMGKSACKGRSIRMDKLDSLVTDHLSNDCWNLRRLQQMLVGDGQLRAARAAEVDKRVSSLEEKLREAEERLRRLYALVEIGARRHGRPSQRPDLRIEVRSRGRSCCPDRACGVRKGQTAIDDSRLQAFSRFMRERLTTGDIPFRKAYLGAIIDRVEVDEGRIRIFGRKDVLEQAVAAGLGPALPGVRTFVHKWRARKNSNLRPPNS